MSSHPKAIETRYAGCRFRSRIEARWAVFFDALKIEWQYEPEGFELPSGWYLPDFYLPKSRYKDLGYDESWIEVKGRSATDHEKRLLQELTSSRGESWGYILSGDIPRSESSWTHLESCGLNGEDAEPQSQNGWPRFLDAWRNEQCQPSRHPDPWISAKDIEACVQAALDAARSARFEHGERG